MTGIYLAPILIFLAPLLLAVLADLAVNRLMLTNGVQGVTVTGLENLCSVVIFFLLLSEFHVSGALGVALICLPKAAVLTISAALTKRLPTISKQRLTAAILLKSFGFAVILLAILWLAGLD